MRDASVGIPWIGSGAAGKAAFMLVREVSDSADMMLPGRVGYYFSINIFVRTVKRPQKEILLINILQNYVLLLC